MLAQLWFKIKTYLKYRSAVVDAHGLHSPFLFDFYNEVVVSKKEFYFFEQFRELLALYSKSLSEAQALFLFRWVAFYQPASVYLTSSNFSVCLALSMALKDRKFNVSSIEGFSDGELAIIEQLGVSIGRNTSTELIYLEELNVHSKEMICKYGCAIVFKPHQTKEKDLIWNQLCAENSISISIDLFQFGILLLNKNQAKQHFTVKMDSLNSYF